MQKSIFVKNPTDEQYNAHVANIIANGIDSGDRTGTGTKRLNGLQFRFDLRDGFPIPSTKKVSFAYIARELEWIVKGNTSQRALKEDLKCSIWDEWADELGRLGPVYGAMWRRRPCVNIQMITLPLDTRKGIVLTEKKVGLITRGYNAKEMASPIFKIWTRMLHAVLSRSSTEWPPNEEVPEVLTRATLSREWQDYHTFAKDFESLPGCEMALASGHDTWGFHTTNNGQGLWAADTLQFVETYKLQLQGMAKYQTNLNLHSGVFDKVVTPQFYIDQLAEAIKDVKNNPESRRIIVDSWEPSLLPASGVKPDQQAKQGLMALAPCHCMFQFLVVEIGGKKHLSIHLTQR